MKAIGDHLIVKPEGGKEVSSSGLILGDSLKQKYTRGVVVAVGDITADLKENDEIVYDNRGVIEFKDSEVDYHCVNLSSVLMAK